MNEALALSWAGVFNQSVGQFLRLRGAGDASSFHVEPEHVLQRDAPVFGDRRPYGLASGAHGS